MDIPLNPGAAYEGLPGPAWREPDAASKRTPPVDPRGHWRQPGPRKPPVIGDWTQVGVYRPESSEEGKVDYPVGGGALGKLEARRIDMECLRQCAEVWD